MNQYDQEYLFIDKADDERLPSLTPDENTADINFQFERLPIGSPPLIFFNGAKEYQTKLRTPSVKALPEILFSGSDILV